MSDAIWKYVSFVNKWYKYMRAMSWNEDEITEG